MKSKTLHICAKCSDLCSASIYDETGKCLGERDGYVPDFMPGDHYGDYVILEIDLVSGKILNWSTPTQAQIDEAFSSEDE